MQYALSVAELDYAFLAEFAKVDRGLLTVMGASYTHVFFPKLPVTHMLYVAGRIRADVDEAPILSLKATSPGKRYEINFEMVPTGLGELRPYNGEVGILFAVAGPIPLIEAGLYQVYIDLDGVKVRTLAFEAEMTPKV